MKKILLSLVSIGAAGVIAFGATQAFFSDTETSTGNILQAGALDLKIDNTCYYNGQVCRDGVWGGNVGIGNTEPCNCTWQLKDLGRGDVFFDLRDLKPGDWEEDTISLRVDNPAWVCLDIDKTANDDNSCTEPEIGDDPSCTDPGPPGNGNLFDGELAQNLHFVFWRDDGDNVFERLEEEDVIQKGLASEILGDARWALADSSTGDPIPAGETVFIGKFFCYGDITEAPVADGPNDPTVASGFECDGKLVNNASQTDVLTGDIVFYAEQARHNDDFLCNPPVSPTPSPTPLPSG